MAVRIECGVGEPNEQEAFASLAQSLSDEWALFTNIPRHITGNGRSGREIDALALSPRGAVVIELKNADGEITVSPLGEWTIRGRILTNKQKRTVYPTQQAETAAQRLKSALGVKARDIYVHSCAVATGRNAHVLMSDPTRYLPVYTLNVAADRIHSLVGDRGKISIEKLKLFFDLVGKTVPTDLECCWSGRARSAEDTEIRFSKLEALYAEGQNQISRLREALIEKDRKIIDHEILISELQKDLACQSREVVESLKFQITKLDSELRRTITESTKAHNRVRVLESMLSASEDRVRSLSNEIKPSSRLEAGHDSDSANFTDKGSAATIPPSRGPLRLRSSISEGGIKQTFSHGRTNKVTVEVKRRKLHGKPQALAPECSQGEIVSPPNSNDAPAPDDSKGWREVDPLIDITFHKDGRWFVRPNGDVLIPFERIKPPNFISSEDLEE